MDGLILLPLSAGGGCGSHPVVSNGSAGSAHLQITTLADTAAKYPTCEEQS